MSTSNYHFTYDATLELFHPTHLFASVFMVSYNTVKNGFKGIHLNYRGRIAIRKQNRNALLPWNMSKKHTERFALHHEYRDGPNRLSLKFRLRPLTTAERTGRRSNNGSDHVRTASTSAEHTWKRPSDSYRVHRAPVASVSSQRSPNGVVRVRCTSILHPPGP